MGPDRSNWLLMICFTTIKENVHLRWKYLENDANWIRMIPRFTTQGFPSPFNRYNSVTGLVLIAVMVRWTNQALLWKFNNGKYRYWFLVVDSKNRENLISGNVNTELKLIWQSYLKFSFAQVEKMEISSAFMVCYREQKSDCVETWSWVVSVKSYSMLQSK